MAGDTSFNHFEKILEFLAEITSLSDLEQVLDLFISRAPELLKVRRCSVYLLPEFVTAYTGALIEGDEKAIPTRAKPERFIVLARTQYPEKVAYIGKMFYPSGVDLTGWVFKTGEPLRMKNSRDARELAAIDPELRRSTRYAFAERDDVPNEPRPILYLPLKTNANTIGVLKLHKPERREFSIEDEKLATVIAQVIAGVSEKIQIVRDRDKKILSLAELSTKGNLEDVFNHVTSAAREMLDCPKCELYLRNEAGDRIVLKHHNGHRYVHPKKVEFPRGTELLGWVFRTGHALYLDDLHKYLDKKYLDDALLAQICDTTDVDHEDREIVAANKKFIRSLKHPIPFMAVPVFANDDSVQGVLCAHFLTTTSFKRTTPFSEAELQRLKAFATTLSFATLFDAARTKSEILIQLGQRRDISQLYEFVVQSLSKVIYGTDCFIFELDRRKHLNLVASAGGTAKIQYELGQGKTGFAAKARSPLIIHHFGTGNSQLKRLQARKVEILDRYPSDLVIDLQNADQRAEALLCLKNGQNAATDIRENFLALAETQPITELGLPSDYLELYRELGSSPSHSFAAIPIHLDNRELGGMITIARAVGRNPFAFDDIEFVESLAYQLGSTLSGQQLLTQREQFIIGLAHEFDLPLTGLISAAEAATELTRSKQKRALEHLIGEAQLLSLKVQTALVILSGQTPQRLFSTHSIYRPLIKAREMFQREAQDKGCFIRKPKTKGSHEEFPTIQMSVGDLETAFKNLIHNAVKYSYKASGTSPQRYVNIWGYWADAERTRYSVEIQNYGVGIMEDEIRSRSIFEKYVRGDRSSDRSRTGAGFGLTHARQIIEDLHKGRIDVTSESQEGGAYLTSFIVTLPVVQEQSTMTSSTSFAADHFGG